ncbi:MAG: 30S ribosomal protein S12 methylthiotransferase RimO [Deltaproteobacteria bacterium]|nr:MAG: 30S ribosomal protein S12 methylthiotransferase RimO [Deltaproteobacteria bacterium]
MGKKVHLVSLGCPKNRVDSEVMLGTLRQQGYEVTSDADDADVLVVNTCSFIGPAKEESVEAILELAEVKARREGRKLVVTGCLAQRYGEALERELPEVDHFLGTGAFLKIAEVLGGPRALIGRPELRYDADTPRVRSTRGGSAYLKVAEGCDNACAFCIIPTLRGPQRSRPVEDLLREAERLVAGGVRELNLVAQDLTAYGHDLPDRPHLADLLARLTEVEGLRWIRMLYAFPRPLPERFFECWIQSPKVLPYIDMPLQHVTPRMLERMRRPRNMDLVRRQLETFRERVGEAKGGFVFRTTFIVGHPGETEADFAALCDFVRECRFDRVGVFTYSDEEGTAAFDQDEKVPGEVAEARRAHLMEIQREIAREKNRALLGRTVEVLVEGASEETDLLLQGRYWGQAPEIDGQVYINRGEAAPGSLVPVEITEAADYDLVGGIPGEWGYQPLSRREVAE